jgi:hypothetical protein
MANSNTRTQGCTQSVTLPHLGGPLPQYVVVHYIPNASEWRITNIEIYLDEALTDLRADGIEFDTMPREVQFALLMHLNAKDAASRAQRGFQRLWDDIQADAAAARVLEGA